MAEKQYYRKVEQWSTHHLHARKCERVERLCLMCNKIFMSLHNGNRRCLSCTAKLGFYKNEFVPIIYKSFQGNKNNHIIIN